MPYYLQIKGRYQTVQFGPMFSRLQDFRRATRRQLRDATRAERREAELADQPDVATRARRYAETLARNPDLTKSRAEGSIVVRSGPVRPSVPLLPRFETKSTSSRPFSPHRLPVKMWIASQYRAFVRRDWQA